MRQKNPSRGSKRSQQDNPSRKNPLNGLVEWIEVQFWRFVFKLTIILLTQWITILGRRQLYLSKFSSSNFDRKRTIFGRFKRLRNMLEKPCDSNGIWNEESFWNFTPILYCFQYHTGTVWQAILSVLWSNAWHGNTVHNRYQIYARIAVIPPWLIFKAYPKIVLGSLFNFFIKTFI